MIAVLFFLARGSVIVFADGTGGVLLQPCAHALGMEDVFTWQCHTLFSLLECAVAHNADILLLLWFFLLGFELGDWEFLYLLLG